MNVLIDATNFMPTACLQNAAKTPVPGAMVFAGPLLQRNCACGGSAGLANDCDDCSSKKLSLQRSTHESEKARRHEGVPAIVHEVLRSPGQPLDPSTRAFMEPRLGHDFSRVRVHTDARAADSARAVNAAAYTVGREVVFGEGQYAPSSLKGRWVLAHELAHVIQQDGDDATEMSEIGLANQDSHEVEAGRSADHALLSSSAGTAKPGLSSPVTLQPIHPVLAAAGVLAAMGACAYAFYRYALSNYSYQQGYNDKFMHCYASCKVASWCGGGPVGPGLLLGMVISEVVGILKEVADYIKDELHIGTPADASWEDWIADQYGLFCALNTFSTCAGCCEHAPGAIHPVASAGGEAGTTAVAAAGSESSSGLAEAGQMT